MSSITPQSNGLATLVARVFLSILFILAGFSKLTAISGTAVGFEKMGLPVPVITAGLVGLVEFVGGLAILVGFQTRIAAVIVALFTIGATLVAHVSPFDQTSVLKNLAIAGGLILLALQGAGSISIDAKRG